MALVTAFQVKEGEEVETAPDGPTWTGMAGIVSGENTTVAIGLQALVPALLVAFTTHWVDTPLTKGVDNVTEHVPVPDGQPAAVAVKFDITPLFESHTA